MEFPNLVKEKGWKDLQIHQPCEKFGSKFKFWQHFQFFLKNLPFDFKMSYLFPLKSYP